MRRKFELEEDMRSVLQTSDNAVVRFSMPTPYAEPLPSPVSGFAKLDQVPAAPAGYWPCFPSRDGSPNIAGCKNSPDMVLAEFSEWLGPGTYPTSSPAVSRAAAYSSFDLTMSNSLTFQPSAHAVSPLYSVVPNESASVQHRQSPMTANSMTQEPQMIMPHQVMECRLISVKLIIITHHHHHSSSSSFIIIIILFFKEKLTNAASDKNIE